MATGRFPLLLPLNGIRDLTQVMRNVNADARHTNSVASVTSSGAGSRSRGNLFDKLSRVLPCHDINGKSLKEREGLK